MAQTLAGLNTGSREHVVQLAPRQLPIALVARDVKVDAVGGLVGHVISDQIGNEVHHGRHVFRAAWVIGHGDHGELLQEA